MRLTLHRTARVIGLTAALSLLVAAPVTAAPATPARHGDGITVVATGLDNPRQLSFGWHGALFVAEAGRGGDGPCFDGAEGGIVCFGTTGAVTRILGRSQRRVLTGLPSIAAQGDAENPAGSSAAGVGDVAQVGRTSLAVLIGLGADPAIRNTLPSAGRKLGTLVETDWRTGRSRRVADIAGYEARTNPIADPDSNPVGLLVTCGQYVVVDAGGNTVVAVGNRGRLSTLAVLPDALTDAPPFLGLPPGTRIPYQAVPTSTAVGPDGALYVSQLTGFPFPAGASTIWRIGRNGALTPYATGLTNVTSLAFSGRHLYAVQLSTAGLLTGPVGSLVEVVRSGPPRVVAGDLFAPYGIAIRGRAAYVTTGSVSAGGGEVLRIPLG